MHLFSIFSLVIANRSAAHSHCNVHLSIFIDTTQGKGTLIELLQKHFPDNKFGFSVSHTTRKPREGEKDKVHYNFTTVENIKKEIDEGKFVEYAEVHGNYYGTR